MNKFGPSISSLQITVVRAKRLLKDSWPFILSAISVMIYMRTDQIMLGQMVGDDAVGIYSAATRMSEVWYFIPLIISNSVFPAILGSKIRDKKEYYERLQKLYDILVFISLCVALPMTFLAGPIVVFFYGQAYSTSGPILAIHIWTSIFVALGVASGKSFLAENRQILIFYRAALGAIINVALNFILIPKYGAIGAAIATVFANIAATYIFDLFYKETREMFRMKTQALTLYFMIQKIRRLNINFK
jgi:PST family polysaccharide transporter